MGEYMEIDVSEAIESKEGGFWFDFEQALVNKDSRDDQVYSEGDLSSENRGPCRFLMRGQCVKGRSCPYRHQRAERSIVCKHWLRALCKKGDQCEFLHQYDLSKMPECYFYTKYGECTNPECLYRHINSDEKTTECPWYKKGFCKHGDRCRLKHVHKMLCDKYYAGFCPDGPACKFGHPQWEAPLLFLNSPAGQAGGGGALAGGESGPHSFRPNMQLICHTCGQPGHKASFCPQQPERGEKKPLDQVTCHKCGEKGHFANHCPLPYGVGGPTARQMLAQVQPQNAHTQPFQQQQQSNYYQGGGAY